MKRHILISFIVGFLVLGTFGQAPEFFRQQVIVRDNNNHILPNRSLSALVSVRMGSETGTVVYSETFSLISNMNGLVNFTVGMGINVSGDLASIDWSDGLYFVEISIDPDNGNNYTISHIHAIQSVPYAFYSDTTGFASVLDYNNLQNKPQVITQEQSDKIDLLTVTAALDLDLLRTNVGLNSQKVAFPGFGNTAGKAYEILWSKIGDDAYYPSGAVGLGVPTSSGFGSSLLHVNGAVLYDGTPPENSPGLFYYHSDDMGHFTYIDNTNTEINLSKNVKYIYEKWTGVYRTNYVQGQPVYTLLRVKYDGQSYYNAFIKNSLLFGKGATLDYNMNGNTMALADTKIRFKFDDTSNSGSFPNNDWQMVFNDIGENGDNYLAIADTTHLTVPFKVMAETPDHTLFVNANGFVGISDDTPDYPLDINGTLQATAFTGDASMLNGTFTGTGLLVNTGSTTLNADNDSDMNGDLEFTTQNTNRLVVTNSGDVKIGSGLPSENLDVDGTTTVSDNLYVTNYLQTESSASGTIYSDPYAGGFLFSYDIQNKDVVIFNPTSNDISIAQFINGVQGQKFTLINKGNYNVSLFVPNMPAISPHIPKNGSATFVMITNTLSALTDIVVAP